MLTITFKSSMATDLAKMSPIPLKLIVTVDDRDVVALGSGDQQTIPVEAGWRSIGVKRSSEARASARRSVDERLEAGQRYDFVLEFVGGGPAIRKVSGAELPALQLSLRVKALDEVEARLLGDSGLLGQSRGARPIEAEFEGLVLTGQEKRRLSALIRETLASTAGSSVELKGTINGVKFEATMEKDRDGRAEVGFEGLRFGDEQELREFMAPLEREALKTLRLDGSVAGRTLRVRR